MAPISSLYQSPGRNPSKGKFSTVDSSQSCIEQLIETESLTILYEII